MQKIRAKSVKSNEEQVKLVWRKSNLASIASLIGGKSKESC